MKNLRRGFKVRSFAWFLSNCDPNALNVLVALFDIMLLGFPFKCIFVISKKAGEICRVKMRRRARCSWICDSDPFYWWWIFPIQFSLSTIIIIMLPLVSDYRYILTVTMNYAPLYFLWQKCMQYCSYWFLHDVASAFKWNFPVSSTSKTYKDPPARTIIR